MCSSDNNAVHELVCGNKISTDGWAKISLFLAYPAEFKHLVKKSLNEQTRLIRCGSVSRISDSVDFRRRLANRCILKSTEVPFNHARIVFAIAAGTVNPTANGNGA